MRQTLNLKAHNMFTLTDGMLAINSNYFIFNNIIYFFIKFTHGPQPLYITVKENIAFFQDTFTMSITKNIARQKIIK